MRTRFLPLIAGVILPFFQGRAEIAPVADSTSPLPLPSATLQVPTPDPAPSASPVPSLFDQPDPPAAPSPAKEPPVAPAASGQQAQVSTVDAAKSDAAKSDPPANAPTPANGPSPTATNTDDQDKGTNPPAPVTASAQAPSETNVPSAGVDSTPKVSSAASVQPAVSAPTPSIPVDSPPNLQESPDKMAASAPVPPSENVTLNLINRLVQRGILSKEDSIDLIRQAKEDAARVTQQNQATQMASQQAAAAQQMAVEAGAPPASDDSVSVSYVPEIVKTEMRDEIKRDVMAAAQSEGWNQPNYPAWLSKIRPFMNFRLRAQGNYFPSSDSVTNSAETLDTLNFNAINTGSPLNMVQIPGPAGPLSAVAPNSIFPSANSPTGYYMMQNPPVNPPTVDTGTQRDMLRIRFRFGADIDLGENFTSGFRVGTGQNGSPVSENQTIGLPGTTSQGGNFSSYAIWLDRAFLKYELGTDPDHFIAADFGRFDNPFFTPTTIMWANDIGFDGVALQGRYKLLKGFTPFASAGFFPVFNTDLNYASTQQPKYASNDKYLGAAQAGIDWKITKDLSFKGAAGYYAFQNVAGQVSSPGVTPSSQTQMSTDASRPSFAQRGNTYVELRNIRKVDKYDAQGNVINTTTANYIYDPTTPAVPPQYINQYQYFGLATPFNILSANGRLEYRHWEPFVVSLSGEWDQNVAFNRQNVLTAGPAPGPDNNYNQTLINGPVNNLNSSGSYNGGNNAWIAQLKVGSGALQKRWDWDFGVSYRYVESDAVIDAFSDADFGGGGTNLKGWAIGGNLALSRSVFIGARWLNATGIAGPTYKSDILQVDLNALF